MTGGMGNGTPAQPTGLKRLFSCWVYTVGKESKPGQVGCCESPNHPVLRTWTTPQHHNSPSVAVYVTI